MNANAMKSLKLIALSALVLAGCDPFTKAPAGTPRVDRAIATGSLVQEAATTADQANIQVADVTLDATLNLWFNVALDPTTVQAGPNFDPATGLPTDPVAATNALASPLATKTGFVDGDVIVYQPGSAVNGGIIQAIATTRYWPAGPLVLGGTVKDLYGTPGTFKATFNVSFIPVFVPTDPYTIDMAWANDVTATGYTIEFQVDTSGGVQPDPAAWATLATGVPYNDPGTTGWNSAYRVEALTPGTDYWFRVLPEPANAAINSTPALTSTAGQPSLKATGNPVGSTGVAQDGVVNLSWARMRAATYLVQSSDDGTTWTDVDPVATPMYQVAGATPVHVTTNPIPASVLNPYVLELQQVPVGTHHYRVVPAWAGVNNNAAAYAQAAAGQGTPTKTATAVVAH